MIGGGTGYAPLRAMLNELATRDDRRYLHLYWGGRTAADLYEHAELMARAAHHPHFRYTPVISTPDPDWTGRTGFVHAVALADLPRLADYDVYASGPPAMVEAIRQEFVERGLPPEQLFFDSFDFAPDTLAKMGPGTP
jgi:CDP-4-dehydro-6-deoxyglucose reductase